MALLNVIDELDTARDVSVNRLPIRRLREIACAHEVLGTNNLHAHTHNKFVRCAPQTIVFKAIAAGESFVLSRTFDLFEFCRSEAVGLESSQTAESAE